MANNSGMNLARIEFMTIEALHFAAPSLRRRRSRSGVVAMQTRRRLAEQMTCPVISSYVGQAEVFLDENLTVEQEITEGLVSAYLPVAVGLSSLLSLVLFIINS